MFERHTFKTDVYGHRPVDFPPPGPYWHMGFTCNPNDESLSNEHAKVVAILPKGVRLVDWWPTACAVETIEVDAIVFTDRFPRPDWWQAPLSVVPPT